MRTLGLRRWRHGPRPGDLSIDFHTGGIAAKLLMNTHDTFRGTKSYLVPTVFDRVDPLLETVRPMMSNGPTQFVALCTMNTLLVAPCARHLNFLLSAVDTWIESLPLDRAMWIELGIGRKVIAWFDAVVVEQPAILGRSQPLRDRIERIVGQLIALGVAEAHELEKRMLIL